MGFVAGGEEAAVEDEKGGSEDVNKVRANGLEFRNSFQPPFMCCVIFYACNLCDMIVIYIKMIWEGVGSFGKGFFDVWSVGCSGVFGVGGCSWRDEGG